MSCDVSTEVSPRAVFHFDDSMSYPNQNDLALPHCARLRYVVPWGVILLRRIAILLAIEWRHVLVRNDRRNYMRSHDWWNRVVLEIGRICLRERPDDDGHSRRPADEILRKC